MKSLAIFYIILNSVVMLAQPPTTGLIMHLPFSGNANDASGNGNNGIIFNATLTSDRLGIPNSAYYFNSSNSRIEIPDNPSLQPASLSLGAWVYYNAVPGDIQTILDKPYLSGTLDPYAIWFQNSVPNTIASSGINYVVASSATAPVAGYWFHLMQTFDDASDQLKLYVNGMEAASVSFNYSLTYDASPFLIGISQENGVYNYPFNGKIDEIRMYDHALTATEVQALYAFECQMNNPEACNGVDDDCDGMIDEEVASNVSTPNHHISLNPAYVQVGNMGTFPIEGTVMFWFNASVVENFRNPFSTACLGGCNNGIRVEENNGGLGYLIGNDAGVWSPGEWIIQPGEFQANTWYHIILIWDQVSGYVKTYKNGLLVSNLPHNTWPSQFHHVTIGYGYDLSRQFKGKMDDVAIFNRALDTCDIEFYIQAVNSNDPGLIGYWSFDGNGLDGNVLSVANEADATTGQHNGLMLAIAAHLFLKIVPFHRSIH